MMYRVIRYFTDLQDEDHEYNVGDEFPRQGITVTSERIAELASNKNRQKVPLIEEVVTETAATVAAEETTETVEQPVERKKRKKRGE